MVIKITHEVGLCNSFPFFRRFPQFRTIKQDEKLTAIWRTKMAKSLSININETAQIPSLIKRASDAFRTTRLLFEAMPDAWNQCLSPLIRYDIGLTDTFPGGQRGLTADGDNHQVNRDMMRRAY